MKRGAAALTLASLLALLSPAFAQPPPPPVFSDAVLEQFPVATGGAVLVVPVTIDGKDYPFILDTGASATMFDTSLRPLLGKPVGLSTVGAVNGVVELEQFAAPAASLGKLPLPRGEVFLHDMSKLREVAGTDLRGFLGMDFLRDYVVTVDFDRGTVTFRRQAPHGSGQAVPLHVGRRGRPAVKAGVGAGPPILFTVDTGWEGLNSALLREKEYTALVKAGRARTEGQALSITLTGTRTEVHGRLAALSVGPFALRELSVVVSGANLLGLSFWSRFRVTFDFPGEVVYLEQGARFDRPDRTDASGLHILRRGGAVTVHSLDAGSPAEKCGIRPGDVLVEVDGAPAPQGALFPLRQLFSQSGRTVPLRLRRGGVDRTVTLTLPN